MKVERWHKIDTHVVGVYDAITAMKKNGPKFLHERDAKKLADAFASLMYEYGYPEFAHEAAQERMRA